MENGMRNKRMLLRDNMFQINESQTTLFYYSVHKPGKIKFIYSKQESNFLISFISLYKWGETLTIGPL